MRIADLRQDPTVEVAINIEGEKITFVLNTFNIEDRITLSSVGGTAAVQKFFEEKFYKVIERWSLEDPITQENVYTLVTSSPAITMQLWSAIATIHTEELASLGQRIDTLKKN